MGYFVFHAIHHLLYVFVLFMIHVLCKLLVVIERVDATTCQVVDIVHVSVQVPHTSAPYKCPVQVPVQVLVKVPTLRNRNFVL